ncbi:hypothetical protein B5P46_11710 [Rhizobium leguminosarum]|uniref:Uncharacterized protein n=1 Tax=Rhizobium leguminosarum TaxID=384 RepID=A0A4Q1UCN2_RHILE|nr:hypothetical protein [Rhizobium leguminosarum]RXT29341.1 hypothetical protein B5P46_11710 [Rhizobium leguminosarum]
MTLAENTVGAEEIAAALELTKEHFLRKVRTLTEMEGMPARLPGNARRPRWSRTAVSRWLDTYGDRKRAAETKAEADEAVLANRQALHLAYVRPDRAAFTGPRLAIDNTGARA